MDSDTRMTEAVNGYRALADELATKWGDLASSIAAKIDADEYDGKAMLDAWAKSTRLYVETSYQMWSKALDAAAILSRRPGERHLVDSDPFESPLPGATLTVVEPLEGKSGVLIAKVDPSKLPEDETTFILSADATGYESDKYKGKVLASRGGDTALKKVFIVVE